MAVIFYEMGLVRRLSALRTIYLDAILYFGVWIPDAGERLMSFEAAVVGAVAGGHPPSEEQWRIMRAGDSLNVVHDVTTWSLNFENFRAPCPAKVYYQDWVPFLPPISAFASSYLRPWNLPQPDNPP